MTKKQLKKLIKKNKKLSQIKQILRVRKELHKDLNIIKYPVLQKFIYDNADLIIQDLGHKNSDKLYRLMKKQDEKLKRVNQT